GSVSALLAQSEVCTSIFVCFVGASPRAGSEPPSHSFWHKYCKNNHLGTCLRRWVTKLSSLTTGPTHAHCRYAGVCHVTSVGDRASPRRRFPLGNALCVLRQLLFRRCRLCPLGWPVSVR